MPFIVPLTSSDYVERDTQREGESEKIGIITVSFDFAIHLQINALAFVDFPEMLWYEMLLLFIAS